LRENGVYTIVCRFTAPYFERTFLVPPCGVNAVIINVIVFTQPDIEELAFIGHIHYSFTSLEEQLSYLRFLINFKGLWHLALAIFDLDNTLLGGDSDYLWGQFLIEQGIVDKTSYEQENHRYYLEYQQGTLDIQEFLKFQLRPLAEHDMNRLLKWRERFIREKIQPIILPAALDLIQNHRDNGDALLVITATNRFITEPIVKAMSIETLIATEPEMINGRYTGRVDGTPCFREGKVQRLNQWLKSNGENLAASTFYSDSHNDLPLLDLVTYPVAVDPDDTLAQHAEMRGWPVISLR